MQWQSVLREEIQFDGFQKTGIASSLEDSFHGCRAGQPLFTLSISMSRKLFTVSKALESLPPDSRPFSCQGVYLNMTSCGDLVLLEFECVKGHNLHLVSLDCNTQRVKVTVYL